MLFKKDLELREQFLSRYLGSVTADDFMTKGFSWTQIHSYIEDWTMQAGHQLRLGVFPFLKMQTTQRERFLAVSLIYLSNLIDFHQFILADPAIQVRNLLQAGKDTGSRRYQDCRFPIRSRPGGMGNWPRNCGSIVEKAVRAWRGVRYCWLLKRRRESRW